MQDNLPCGRQSATVLRGLQQWTSLETCPKKPQSDQAVSDEDIEVPRSTNLHHKSAPNLLHVSLHPRWQISTLPRAALSPLRFSAPLSHSPPRSTILVLAGTTTFQTQPFRSTRCPRPIATPHALPRAVSTPQAVPCVALACRACSHRIIC